MTKDVTFGALGLFCKYAFAARFYFGGWRFIHGRVLVKLLTLNKHGIAKASKISYWG